MASPYGMFAPGASISERPRSYKYDDDVTTSMPDWIENPSEGFRVVTGRGRDESSAMRDATSGAMGASPSDTHVQKEGNEFIAYALVEEAVPGEVEGGMLDTYESPALELDEDEGRGISLGDVGPEAEARRRLKRRELYPELLLEEQKRQDRASATSGRDPNIPDEFDRPPVGEESIAAEARGYRSLSRDRVYEIIKKDNPQLSEQELNRVVEKVIAAGGQFRTEPSLEEQITDVREPARLPSRTAPGLDIPLFKSAEELAQMTPAERVQYRKDRLRSVGAGGQLRDTATGKTTEELREDIRRGLQDVYRERPTGQPSLAAEKRTISPQQRRGRDDYSGQVAQRQLSVDPRQRGVTRGVAQDAAPDDEGGLLQMLAGLGGDIGGWAKENPELIMAGLQTIGELGGQYKRGRREQEASDAEAQERRMSGAISALTRGRVTPEVGRRAPRTTAGEGMFDVMAGIGRGGTQFLEAKRGREEREEALEMYREDREIAAGERTRERDWAEEDRRRAEEDRTRTRDWAEEDREIAAGERTYERAQAEQARKDAFEERLVASGLSEKEKEKERKRWEREQGRKDREVAVKEREVAVKEAQQAVASVPKIDTVSTADANVIAEGFNAMIDIFDSGWPSETGTLAPERTYGVSAGIQSEFDGLKTALIGRMKNFQELGRLSDTDYKIILDSLPDRDKSSGWNEGKRRGVFRALEIASGGQWKAPPIPSFWDRIGGWGEDDEAPKGESVAVEEVEELSEETEALIERAFDKAGNVVDEDAAEELRQLGLI